VQLCSWQEGRFGRRRREVWKNEGGLEERSKRLVEDDGNLKMQCTSYAQGSSYTQAAQKLCESNMRGVWDVVLIIN
jgi:hypothetical protein